MEQDSGPNNSLFVHIEGVGRVPVWQISELRTEYVFPFSRRVVVTVNGRTRTVRRSGDESAAEIEQKILRRIDEAATRLNDINNAFEQARRLGFDAGREEGKKDAIKQAAKRMRRRLKTQQARAAVRPEPETAPRSENTSCEEAIRASYNEGHRDGYAQMVADVAEWVLNRLDNEIAEYRSVPDSENEFAVVVLTELKAVLRHEFSQFPGAAPAK